METPAAREIVQRLWSEHKFAILARSRALYQEIAKEMASGPPDAGAVVDAIRHAMTLKESNLREAVEEAWAHLMPRVGATARDAMQTVREKNTEEARWVLAALAEHAADAVVAASRLFDPPEAVGVIWLRDRQGPTMYRMEEATPVRVTPAEVGEVLLLAFGEPVVQVLRDCVQRPRTPTEVEAAHGREARRILQAATHLLVLRRIGGYYRSRGMAAQLVLTGLGRI